MKNGELQELLKQWSDTEEVVVVIVLSDDYEPEDGDVLDIETDGDVAFQSGKVTITATAPDN
jgi:hypothetical protein